MHDFRALPAVAAVAITLSATAAFAQNYGQQQYGQRQYAPPPAYGQQQPQYSDQGYDVPPAYSDRTTCDRGQFGNKQVIGTVLGAAVGGLVGNQVGGGSGKTVATIMGVIGGGFLGNQVGKGMDQADQGCLSETLDQAPPDHAVTWRNPNNGYDYRVTPRDEFHRDGRRCRHVESQAIVDGRPTTVTNIACRDRDGHWRFDD